MKPLILPVLATLIVLAPIVTLAAPCEPGSFSVDGEDPCTPCPAGTYSDAAGATACIECEPHTVSAEGATICFECPPGYYQPEAGSPSCLGRTATSCWRAKDLGNPARFSPLAELAAADEISTAPVSLTRATALCTPATFVFPPVTGPGAPMCCYKATGAKPAAPTSFEVTSSLGGTLQLGVVARALVCDQCQGSADTEQTVQCWKVRDLNNPKFQILESVRLIDEYSYDFPIVKRPEMFCSPVSLDGAPVTDPNAQQCCYRVGKAFLSDISESVTDPAGAPLELGVVKRFMVCEPCVATPLP
jgi:hypothetical protein